MVTRQTQRMMKGCKLRRCGGGEGGGSLCSDPSEDECKIDIDVKYNQCVQNISAAHF